MKESFTFRLTLRFALLVTATTAAVFTVGGWLLVQQIERGLQMMHEVEARELGELLGSATALTPREIAARIRRDADSDIALFVIQIEGPDGDVVFRSDNLGAAIMPVGERDLPHWTATLPFLGRVHISSFSHGPWRIQIGSPLQPSERLVQNYVQVGILLTMGVAVLGIGLGYAFSRDTLKPLRMIEAAARRIRADNLSERIPVPAGRDELASLASLLNETFDRLEVSFKQVRQFSADASHELKTPLALIRLNAEKLRPRLATDAEGSEALDDILEEITQLNQVIDRLLFLAKSESGALALELQPLVLETLIQELAEDAQVLAEDRSVRFAVTRRVPGELRAEPDLLRQLLLNLVSNAVAVSPPGGVVAFESFPDGDDWTFVVADEGPGLPEEQRTRIFERFVRFNTGDRIGPQRGHGLGLAICKSIAELHGGTIRAERRLDRSGLRLVVTIPRQPK
ncbi:MAG: ATP-binding protein [Candidatus Didemnitutus sp.]|nr:ATP-binding protein [Candidatus Didemnitutus sp.]